MTDTDPNPTDIAASAGPSSAVTMYTTSWCGFCARLKRGLQSEGIAYD
jgi:mycoredoxin